MPTQADRPSKGEQARRKRTRISLDMSPELRRRIKIGAARRDITVRAYLENIIEQAVRADEQQAGDATPVGPVDALLRLREELVSAHPIIRKGDSTALLREAREERAQRVDRE